MKRLLFTLVAVLFVATAIGQTEGQSVTIGNVKYTLGYGLYPGQPSNPLVAEASAVNTSITSANILGTVTIGGSEFPVIVGNFPGFKNCHQLDTITLNEGILKVAANAFLIVIV